MYNTCKRLKASSDPIRRRRVHKSVSHVKQDPVRRLVRKASNTDMSNMSRKDRAAAGKVYGALLADKGCLRMQRSLREQLQDILPTQSDSILRLAHKTLNFDIKDLTHTAVLAAALNQKLQKDLQKARQKCDRSYQHSRKRGGGRKRRAEEDIVRQKKQRFGDSLSPIQIE